MLSAGNEAVMAATPRPNNERGEMTDKLKPQDADFLMLSRRRFLKWGLCAAAITATLPAAAAIRDIPAGEYLKTADRVQGELNTDALADIDHFMRDYRNGEVKIIDHELLDLLYSLNQHLRSARPFHVISGYRSPATNAMLAARSNGIAKHSLHMEGMAMDIYLPDRALGELRRAALNLRRGGVGYYPKSNFVHVDTGRVRSWQS